MPPKHRPIFDELAELDAALLEMLAKRSRLLGIARTKTTALKRGVSEVDRLLWPQWEQSRLGKQDARRLRRAFDLLQELPAPKREDQADAEAETGPRPEGFVLIQPGDGPANVDMPGPGSLLLTRVWAVLASQAQDHPLRLENPAGADPAGECVKGLNQAGAKLYWEAGALLSRPGGKADFAEKVIYVGEDFQNFCFLLALALPWPGQVKFTGGSALKLADIGDLARPLHWLGARLTSIARQSVGLPARLEASGALPHSFELPDYAPDEIAIALVAAAPSYPHGLELSWTRENLHETLAPVADALTQCGVQTKLEPGRCRISAGEIRLPGSPQLPMEPYMAGALLAVPGLVGGSVCLRGAWPGHLPQWSALERMLDSAGVAVSTDSAGVTASGGQAAGQRVDLAGCTRNLPLAVALAAAHCRDTNVPDRQAEIVNVSIDEEDGAAVRAVCGRLGLSCFVHDAGVKMRPGEGPVDDNAWSSPSPEWAVGFALASYLKPGLRLENPGGVTGLMPHFWNIYNALLRSPEVLASALGPRRKVIKEGEAHDAAPKTGRRFRV